MYKLTFLLTAYARPFYKRLAVAAAIGVAMAAGAAVTGYLEPALIVLGALAALLATAAATLAILVLNVAAAAGMQRAFDRFEAAYDAYRRANNIPDLFYEELDLAEAAERERAGVGASGARP